MITFSRLAKSYDEHAMHPCQGLLALRNEHRTSGGILKSKNDIRPASRLEDVVIEREIDLYTNMNSIKRCGKSACGYSMKYNKSEHFKCFVRKLIRTARPGRTEQ